MTNQMNDLLDKQWKERQDLDIKQKKEIEHLDIKHKKEIETLSSIIDNKMSRSLAKKLTNLRNYDANDLMNLFGNYSTVNGFISKASYDDCFKKITNKTDLTSDERSQLERLLEDIFKTYKQSNGMVDFVELLDGLIILCKNSKEDIVNMSFILNCPNKEDMTLSVFKDHLINNFKLIYLLEPDTIKYMGVSSEDLAIVTATESLKELGKTYLSLDDFLSWYGIIKKETSVKPTSDLIINKKQCIRLTRCKSTIRTGKKCSRKSIKGTDYCYQHSK